jgi:hypothetical protein
MQANDQAITSIVRVSYFVVWLVIVTLVMFLQNIRNTPWLNNAAIKYTDTSIRVEQRSIKFNRTHFAIFSCEQFVSKK